MIVVADSSPLIALSRVGKLHLLRDIFGTLLIPDAVWHEVAGSDPGRPGTLELRSASWIERRSIKDTALANLLRRDLGAGESEAIVLAREASARMLLMDERLGRSAAARLGIPVTGLIGILLEARRLGLVSDPAAIALELRTTAGFWISDDLMNLLSGN